MSDKKPKVTALQMETLRKFRGGWRVDVKRMGTDVERSATLLTKKGLLTCINGWEYQITEAGKAVLVESDPTP